MQNNKYIKLNDVYDKKANKFEYITTENNLETEFEDKSKLGGRLLNSKEIVKQNYSKNEKITFETQQGNDESNYKIATESKQNNMNLQTEHKFQPEIQSSTQQNQIQCQNPNCRAILIYPQGGRLVQCQLCSTITPCTPDILMDSINCGNCYTELLYPCGSTLVKCICGIVNITPYYKN